MNQQQNEPTVQLSKVPDIAATGKDTIFDYTIVFKGRLSEANRWAQRNGYKFVPDQSIYGGYWRKSPEDCLVMW